MSTTPFWQATPTLAIPAGTAGTKQMMREKTCISSSSYIPEQLNHFPENNRRYFLGLEKLGGLYTFSKHDGGASISSQKVIYMCKALAKVLELSTAIVD